MERLMRIALLKDFYGELLTTRQQELLELCYEQDFSLGEIAELKGISRQAVFDNLRRAEKALEGYEEKLGLLAKSQKEEAMLDRLEKACEQQDWQAVRDEIAALRQ